MGEERQGPKRRLTERVAHGLRLPLDMAANLPHMELNGCRELLILRHQGILEYGDTQIDVGTSVGTLRVRGENLELAAMNQEELLLHGLFFSLEFLFE